MPAARKQAGIEWRLTGSLSACSRWIDHPKNLVINLAVNFAIH